MTEPWAFTGESAPLDQPGSTVTLIEGTSFCLSGRSGDLQPGAAHGLFVGDVRELSRLELTLDGLPPQPLAVSLDAPFAATFVSRARPRDGQADGTLLVFRRRFVGDGLREDLTLRNCGREELALVVRVAVEADFANLFAVKEGRACDPGVPPVADGGQARLLLRGAPGGVRREVHVGFAASPRLGDGAAEWAVRLPPGGEWSACLDVATVVGDGAVPPRYRCGEAPTTAMPAARLATWREAVPTVRTDDDALRHAVARSLDDLGGLRMFDPDHPDRVVVAAGAPWFMALFGRDSLLTSYMSLVVDPRLAQGVLETLADFQGTKTDPETEEQPGKILHELRFARSTSLALGSGSVYYGSVDATPLFVVLLGELRRWGLAPDVVDRLLPHADRAIAWIEDHGLRDGYLSYERTTPRGLRNQGWKDSWDGVTYADGRIAEPPIALCEVQGYVYAAYLARAYFADENGDAGRAAELRRKAADLKERFNRDFWLADRGWYALGLDADRRPIDALASNLGHCLWTGIVDEAKAPYVAAHLVSPEMFSGWGVRTLASSMGAYNPISYHNGSVWPHDNAIAVAGLVRYGYLSEAHRIVSGMLDAATHFEGRLPELFAGLGRDEVSTPVSYPTSCSPQAWASATPLMFLRSLLRLDPWVPRGKLWLAPALPERIAELRVGRIPVGRNRLDVSVRDGAWQVDGLGDELELVEEPRSALTAALAPDRTP